MDMKRGLSLMALVGLLVVGSSTPAAASSILYFWDFHIAYDNSLPYEQQHERMTEALGDSQVTSLHTVKFAETLEEFTNTVGNYDLGILFLQQTGKFDSPTAAAEYDAAFAALATAVANGKRAIVDDWGGDNGVAPPALFSNTHLENGLGTDYTGYTAETESFTVFAPSLLFNLNASVDLFDPGWTVPIYGLTVPQGSTCGARFSNNDCAIVFGNDGRTIVNGFLNDTFVSETQGKQLYINEINTLLATPVPEPASMLLVGSGLAAAAARLRRRRQRRGN
ncbi:MAG: PEP-CTERM sorting domain-containing protein [Acidobacteria bacterium]|nr:PEP-CTERM sorting domain-containing protein [Acidobacteriota bacterium]